MATFEVDGVELYYERAGVGDLVVMTHGAWTDGRTWEAVVDHLAGEFGVVTWDRRGHSRSQDSPGPGSVREDASDLADLIEHLDSGPVHVVGNSAGGNVVLNLVASRGDLVRSAAVHEPGPFGLVAESGDPRLVRMMRDDMASTKHTKTLIVEGKHAEAAEYFVDNVAVGPGAWGQFPGQLRTIMEANATTALDDLRDGWDVGSLNVGALAGSSVPLMISMGTESPELEAAAARELARRLPEARFETLPGAGHVPHRTHPESYASMLAEFMVESAGRAAGTGATGSGSD